MERRKTPSIFERTAQALDQLKARRELHRYAQDHGMSPAQEAKLSRQHMKVVYVAPSGERDNAGLPAFAKLTHK